MTNAAGEVVETDPSSTKIFGRAAEAAYGSGWATAVQRGSIFRWYRLLEDVHERRSVEEALRERARFRLITDSVPAMIRLSDETGSTTYLDRNWLQTTGRANSRLSGAGGRMQCILMTEIKVLAKFDEASRSLTGVEAEYRLCRSDGKPAWVIDIGEPRLASDGSFLGFSGSLLDLSER